MIAGYRDDPVQLLRVVEQGIELGPTILGVDQGDLDLELLATLLHSRHFTLVHGRFHRERDKRDWLLREAIRAYEPQPHDWYLVLDPDEKILNGDVLPLILGRVPVDQVAYPIARIEPDGTTWVLPSKLYRATATRYLYLDIGITFRNEVGVLVDWNLDAQQVSPQLPYDVLTAPGWPMIQHYRSPRADSHAADDFYAEGYTTQLQFSAARLFTDLKGIAA